ncbi:YcgN family cysteine cluster protein [Desulfobotulus sp. H1]|uniref:YcgN family cysteine cluster protein n=1 Tax=Desulfobotulus pelophilus TaxID=2823377 RepID=A0ABT3N5F6_9BACT|nr:YcgN family cysteine cluster protein [Desulfobotulus pelophilus]MCW7752692.1 YcgN family cysteine cluster protein [Desulfobotulus pelophilus]
MTFWEKKKMDEMTVEEWESLCDGCGRCCLVKMEDDETGKIYFTRLACQFLDLVSCRCEIYENRFRCEVSCLAVRDCLAHHPHWLPESCAYRCLHEGRKLPDWHPLRHGGSRERAMIASVGPWAVSVMDLDPLHLDPEAFLIRFSGQDGIEVWGYDDEEEEG